MITYEKKKQRRLLGRKKIKGTAYQYYRGQDNKYTYGRTIKEVKEKPKNNKSNSTSSKIITLKTYGLNWLHNVKALEHLNSGTAILGNPVIVDCYVLSKIHYILK